MQPCSGPTRKRPGPPDHVIATTVMADGPQAKRSKPGPPVAAVMARVESSVLGPASAGRRDPPGDKAPAVSPPEIVRDVNVVSDPPRPALAESNAMELTSVRKFTVSGTSSRLKCT